MMTFFFKGATGGSFYENKTEGWNNNTPLKVYSFRNLKKVVLLLSGTCYDADDRFVIPAN